MLLSNRPQILQELRGDRAHQEISSKLSGYPAAQRLAQEVYDFYAESLSLVARSDFAATTFAINLQHAPMAFVSAEVKLQLGTDRVPEALAHELLHLRLPMLGFPLSEAMWVPLELDCYAGDFLAMGQWVLNVVQHEICFQNFIELGFHKKHFLAKPIKRRDYRKRFIRNLRNADSVEIDFPRWCIAYLSHFFTGRHCGDEDSMRYAQDALEWGSRIHPALKRTTAAINSWFEKGAFKNPFEYPRHVNWLLELMRIPLFSGWVNLKSSEEQIPLAVRITNTGDCGGQFLPPFSLSPFC